MTYSLFVHLLHYFCMVALLCVHSRCKVDTFFLLYKYSAGTVKGQYKKPSKFGLGIVIWFQGNVIGNSTNVGKEMYCRNQFEYRKNVLEEMAM